MPASLVWAGMANIHRQINELGRRESVNLLLTGETGTGKNEIARYVHEVSPRGSKAFCVRHCGSLSADGLERELFGGGGPSPSDPANGGLIIAADGGTIFLDAVEAIPSTVQEKLLPLFDERRFRAIGETKDRVANVRIICATDADLENCEGFSKALFHRMAGYTLRVPPLRDRKEAIYELVRGILAALAGPNGRALDLESDALSALMSCDHPGNIRGLQNLLRKTAIDHQGDGPISRSELEAAGLPHPAPPTPTRATDDSLDPWRTNHRYQLLVSAAGSLIGFEDQAARNPAFRHAVVFGAMALLADPTWNSRPPAMGPGYSLPPGSPMFVLTAYTVAAARRVARSTSADGDDGTPRGRYSSPYATQRAGGELEAYVELLVGRSV